MVTKIPYIDAIWCHMMPYDAIWCHTWTTQAYAAEGIIKDTAYSTTVQVNHPEPMFSQLSVPIHWNDLQYLLKMRSGRLIRTWCQNTQNISNSTGWVVFPSSCSLAKDMARQQLSSPVLACADTRVYLREMRRRWNASAESASCFAITCNLAKHSI